MCYSESIFAMDKLETEIFSSIFQFATIFWRRLSFLGGGILFGLHFGANAVSPYFKTRIVKMLNAHICTVKMLY